MDDISQSRVLEPIDPNSLSLISSSSTSNICSNTQDSILKLSYNKPVSSPLYKSEEFSTAKWQFDRKEFEFESNSTPSKNNDPEHQQILHVRKRRSQLMGAKPRIPSKLYQATSKLDLLDEKNLTSLPIPPPRSTENFSNVKRLKLNPINEIRIHNDKTHRRISYGAPQNIFKAAEGDEENGEHPIVLVEDYIPYVEGNDRHATKKRVSISNLKSKMSKRGDLHVPLKLKKIPIQESSKTPSSSVTLVPHILDENFSQDICVSNLQGDDIQTIHADNYESCSISDSVRNVLGDLIRPETPQDNDKYLSDIRTHSQLKKCVVCENPLYEISSLIADTDDFKEIVCGKCTERYEEAAKIFENYEFESSGDSSNETTMSSMDSAVEISRTEDWQLQSDSRPRGRKQQKHQFSQELIKRLQIQSYRSISNERHNKKKESVDCTTMAWFIDAKKKIRWRWRVSGLLPRFLTKQYDTSINSNR